MGEGAVADPAEAVRARRDRMAALRRRFAAQLAALPPETEAKVLLLAESPHAGGPAIAAPEGSLFEYPLAPRVGRGRPLFAVRPGAAGDISLKQDERANEHVAWSEPRGGTCLPTAVACAGALYSVTETGVLSRFDAKSGSLTCKTRIDQAATAFTSSPWAYNGRVFFLSEEGRTFVVAAGETFQLLHVNELDDMALASPALAGDRLVVRTEHRLYSIRRPRSG